MHPCRECGKPVEASAQFCPWCFAFPGTAAEAHHASRQADPVVAAVPAPASAPVATAERVPQTLVASLHLPAEPTSAPPPPTVDSPWAATSLTPSRWPRILLAVGGLALVVAAVAVWSNRSGEDVVRDTTAATAPLELGDPEWKEEAEVVDRAVLKLEDLGAGWTPEGEGHTAVTGTGERELAECLGVPYVKPVAAATSPEFERGANAVGASVAHFADEATATASARQVVHPKFAECNAAYMRELFQDNVPPFAGSGRVFTESAPALPGFPDALRFRGRLHVVADGVGEIDIWLDLVSIVRGPVAVVVFQTRSARPDDAVTTRALQAVVGRL